MNSFTRVVRLGITLSCLLLASVAAAQNVPLACDADNNGVIDKRDITLITAARNTPSTGITDPRDPNRDGVINVLDARFCTTQCTLASCAQVPSPPPPVANAGRAQIVFAGSTVQLDGTGSTSARGDTLSYQWSIVSLPSGSAAALSGSSVPRPTFVADVNGTYQFQLVVTDSNHVASSPTTVNIATEGNSVAPVVNPGVYPTASVGTPVNLDASQTTEVVGDPLLFEWQFVLVPNGSQATFAQGGSPTNSFTPDLPGQYYIQLTVLNTSFQNSTANFMINTVPRYLTPVANPGQAQLATVGTAVELNGSKSTDPDGSAIANYQWTLLYVPPGSRAQLTAPTGVGTSFTPDVAGDYVAQLIVTANGVSSTPATVLISTVSTAPVASASAPESGYTGSPINLTGQGTDANGEPVSFRWSLIFTPEGFAPLGVTSPDTPNASFVPPLMGTYVAQLVVNNGQTDSAPSTSLIQIQTPTTADLSLSEVVNAATAPVGATVTFTTKVTNLGPLPGSSATITDPLPAGLQLVSASASSGTYNSGTWTVGALAVNASATLTLNVMVTASGALTNTATLVTATPPDGNASNNSASQTVTGIVAPNLTVADAVSSSTPVVGKTVTFTITVTDTGGGAALGTVVNDALPSGYTFVSATPSSGTYNSSTGQWTIGTLASGATVTLTLTATVQPTGSYTNTATVLASNTPSGVTSETASTATNPEFPPTVSINAPADNSQFIAPANYNVVVAVGDQSTQSLQSITVYDGTTVIGFADGVQGLPITLTHSVAGQPAGTHVYSAVAVDGNGNSTTSNIVHVTVVAPTASATLLSPVSSSFFVAPATITLLASAASSTGSVNKVEFFQNGVSVGTAAKAPYSVSLTGVPVGTYTYTVQVTDNTSTVASSPVTVTVGSAASFTITSPANGASIADTTINTVSGTVQAPPNSGILVNNLPATITANGSFYVNNVPLQSGSNTVQVVLILPDGTSSTQSITVTSTGQQPFQFQVSQTGTNTQSTGLAPLSVQFTVADVGKAAATEIDLSCMDNGTVNYAVTNPALTGAANTIGPCTYSAPGVYNASVNVVNAPAGQSSSIVYTSTLTIVVLDPNALDAALRSLWSGMNNALTAGDPARALLYLDAPAQGTYGPVFSTLASAMPGIVASYSNPQGNLLTNDIAEYAVNRTINGVNRLFFIYFLRNTAGVWLIDSM